jgi:hypothetical protein
MFFDGVIMKYIFFLCLCILGAWNASLRADTRDIEWYEEKLRTIGMPPLDNFEKDEISKAIKADAETTMMRINRDVNEFLNNAREQGIKFPLLILGSGPKHNVPPSERITKYTVDVESDFNPDLVGSINDPKVMELIPNDSFSQVIWENVPGAGILNTESFDQVYRILKPGGIAQLKLPVASGRLLPILIQETKFRNQIDPKYGNGLKLIVDEDSVMRFNAEALDFVYSGREIFTFKKEETS